MILARPKRNPRLKRIENGITQFYCTNCGRYKPKEQFYRDTDSMAGVTSHCRICKKRKKAKNRKRQELPYYLNDMTPIENKNSDHRNCF